ncbi:glycosyltransferase family 1 protein [Mucilaginibacter sp.]|uniref:glycosyltransferase family 4 protein n=1 Tax=Mucilaginibacter sp. TaxID=1882438 RepID=UPI0025F005DE|nr:glycosyltransferase family 1 protein [Mucilaginibacter sp.]
MSLQIFLDNIVFNIQKFGGASTYWNELQKYFVKLNNVNIIIQNKEQRQSALFENQTKSYDTNYILEDLLPSFLTRYLPLTVRLPAKSLYHASYYRTCLQKDVVNIFTVHDFTHKKGLASKFPRKLVHISLTGIGIRNADGIICISENTKKDLMFYYPQIPENKVKVIYHGVSEHFFPIEKTSNNILKDVLNVNEPFILFIGKREGYKKFDIVAEAVEKVADLNLVIVGGGELSAEELIYLNSNLAGRFIKLDGLNNTELNTLYNYAFALIYPSVYEGFGFPVVEAMRAGCPVISNNLSSVPEVGGDAIMMITEISADAIVEKINLLRQNEVRLSMINRGLKQSVKFNWEKCFKETYSFYKEIYNRRFSE